VAGLLIGLALVVIYFSLAHRTGNWLAERGIGTQAAIIAAACLILAFLLPTETATSLAGALLGFGLGSLAESHLLDALPRSGLRRAAGRMAVGVLIVGAAYTVVYVILGMTGESRLTVMLNVLLHAGLGLTATWLVPWVFVRLGLSTAA
jgi:hypothetical protein